MRARRVAVAHPARARISVLVADSHGVMRDGLRHILKSQRDISVVAAVSNGSASVRAAERHAPRVALLGIAMAGLSGVEAARAILAKSPGIAIVIVAAHASELVIDATREAGALGCLTNESSADDVLRAVRSAAAGKSFVGRSYAEADAPYGVRPGDADLEPITATERRILKQVVEGRSNAQVAEILGLSSRTVETYRLRLMRKLQIDHLPSLVKFAIRHGITPLD